MSTQSEQTKMARTDYPVHELIKNRWSPRAFSDQPVDRELLRQLFDAARWAPSSFNEQPWRFVVATRNEPEEFEQLSLILKEGNRTWAAKAPVLGVTIYKTYFERNEKPNRVALHDLGQAIAYLTFEATRHDLYVHQMAGIQLEAAREQIQIPEGFEPATMFAIGYLGDPDRLPEKFQKSEKSERSRKKIDEIAFRGTWDGWEKL